MDAILGTEVIGKPSSQPGSLNPEKFQAIIGFFLAISTITLGLRFWTRGRLSGTIDWDDWFLLVSHVFAVVVDGLFLYVGHVYRNSTDHHTALPFDKLNSYYLFGIAAYLVGGVFFKLSLTVFFLKISQRQWQKRLITGTVTTYVVFLVAYMMVLLFRCGVPNPADILGRVDCKINWSVLFPMSFVVAVLNALVYCVFAMTPIFIVLNQGKMSIAARRAVIILTIIAILGCMLSIARIPFVVYLELGPTFYNRVGKISLLSVIETGLGTTIISCVALRPLTTVWVDTVGRAWAHMKGLEYHKDFEQPRRYVPRYNMQPTTTYQDILVDGPTLRTIGVLPDCDDDDDMLPCPPRAQQKKPIYMSSISEIMFEQMHPARNHSTV